MDTWFTSDQHYGHKNILVYAHRPFQDVAEMEDELVARHNALVKPTDIVIEVGDFTFNERLVTGLLKRLHGRHILICGNHDRAYRSHRSAAYWQKKYLEFGFAQVLQEYEVTMAGQSVRVDHMPYINDSERHVKYEEYRPKDDGRWLLHGHVHTAWKFCQKMINVGVDVWDYKPVHFDELAALIK
jgi:calcineurin-like phosphoesterase family protein